ncbi:MAG: single-stranded-DNA-specific exonuclease RecJ, partial [Acidobacteria bacterium]|nr:single-stranded-DNA-specific exonuclease RecJ [Acidobacteriota bacterium]
GDYDVDGVTATALFTAVFKACGLAVDAILPHRMEEGYGFQPVHAERAAEAGCRVVVTADCGTTATAAVAAARDRSLDVIVTDHHIPGPELPAGTVQVNPKQDDCPYPFKELSGAGLAFKLALAVADRCGKPVELAKLLRIACLGTIADLVPLVGENRTIAALGLEALSATQSVGLRALIRQSGLKKAAVTAVDVGFRLGPRINAAGRMDSAESALELLLCRDAVRAESLARRLDAWNRQRQEAEQRAVEEARAMIEALPELPRVLVAWSPDWHRGVVGIAAGRLARDLHRPALLLAVDGDSAVGSGRSIHGFHLHEFLLPWRPRMERFGGHAQAVGLTVPVDALEDLRGEWQEAAATLDEGLFERRHRYELEVAPGEAGERLLAELAALEPHGQDNQRPLLRVGPLRLAAPPRHFGRGHLWAPALGDDGGEVRLLGWSWQSRVSDLAGRFEVLAYLERDDYRGGTTLRLVDARPAGSAATTP